MLRNPAFLAVVLASSMIQSSHALYYGFSTMDWRAGGLDGTVIGMLWGLGVAAEIVLFAFSGRLPKSLRPTTLLAIGGLGAIVRWTAMAFDPPTALLPALQILHAASFGAAHLGMMGFLARAVPRELAATAQGVCRDLVGHRQRLGDVRLGLCLCRVGQPRLPGHGGDGARRPVQRALRRAALEGLSGQRTQSSELHSRIHRRQLGAAQEHHLG